jgi:hypothetical protein
MLVNTFAINIAEDDFLFKRSEANINEKSFEKEKKILNGICNTHKLKLNRH